jgi:hypothetical protein
VVHIHRRGVSMMHLAHCHAVKARMRPEREYRRIYYRKLGITDFE